jgi:branched-subunit amino acid transport protein
VWNINWRADKEEIMNIWVIMIAAGLITYIMRLFFILLVGKKEIPDNIRTGLQFVPPAVLTAIIVPEVIFSDDVIQLSTRNYRLIAAVLACIVAWKTKSAILTVIIGMLALWILQLLNF